MELLEDEEENENQVINGDPLPKIKQKNKNSLLSKILLICLILIIIALIIVVILQAVKIKRNNSELKILENAGYVELWNTLYGIKKENLSYVEENTMSNTFKEGGINYNIEIGEINGGSDYTKNENNKYTLYIPQEALNKKDNDYNGIILFIHGEDEKKENIEYYCSRYAKKGFIAATMDYTELSENIPNSNVFRIMDEITYCLTHIKKVLVNEYKFYENRLEGSLGGYSIGAYFAMLYGYSMKRSFPIPIKFIINLAGFLDLDPKFWYKLSKYNDTLADIEPNTIDLAIKNNKIIKIHDNEIFFLNKMNEFLGKRYKDEEIRQMLNGNKINYKSEEYIKLFKSSKYFFVTYHINETNEYTPILSEYAGNDENIGIANFKYLRQKNIQNKNLTIDVVYMRYANHSLIDYDTDNGVNAMRDLNTKVLEFTKNYFIDADEYFDNGGRFESWHSLFGDKIENISYVNNSIIENTYKENGINYNKEIGNVNGGEDYEGNENNKYDLFVPIKAINKKNNYNGVMLFIHGGGGNIKTMEYFCARYAKMGYITATMHYNEIKADLIHTSILFIQVYLACLMKLEHA